MVPVWIAAALLAPPISGADHAGDRAAEQDAADDRADRTPSLRSAASGP
jgi:hypothetical protein